MVCRPRPFSSQTVAILLLALCAAGCRPTPPHGIGDHQTTPAAASLATQVTAVTAGRATRITATAPLSDAEWESLRGLAGLRELILRAGVADDSRAELLATLPDIERLWLRDSPLSDAGFRSMARCATLRDLNVPQAACTPAGIRALAALPDLRSLRLGGAPLARAGVDVARAVAELPTLRSLHLIDVPLGDDGLAAIARLPNLRNLYLDGAEVADESWERYFESHPGVHVHVDQTHHDRDPGRDHD
jgi:hypothetical protein